LSGATFIKQTGSMKICFGDVDFSMIDLLNGFLS
jgi:hypothetical protein